jgi:hypothetical protein
VILLEDLAKAAVGSSQGIISPTLKSKGRRGGNGCGDGEHLRRRSAWIQPLGVADARPVVAADTSLGSASGEQRLSRCDRVFRLIAAPPPIVG